MLLAEEDMFSKPWLRDIESGKWSNHESGLPIIILK